MVLRAVLLVFLGLAALPAQAREPRFGLPLDCVPGESCFIQNYVDADAGPGAADFTCGPLSYDGHKGTDFALISPAAMAEGVAVRAAAPGVVRAVRDGMPDTGLDGTPPGMLEGKDCGNGVVIDHGGGWETQYCHLRAGSVAVRTGDRVAMGAKLGLVGYSGRTEFVHLHLSIRRDGATVDPFNSDGVTACTGGDGPEDDLWATPLAYVPGGIIALGAAEGVPDYAAVKAGEAGARRIAPDAPALVGWVHLFGGQAGDRVEISLIAPDGGVFFRHEELLEKTQAQLMRAAGKRTPPAGWVPGLWTVRAGLSRGAAVIDSAEARVEVAP